MITIIDENLLEIAVSSEECGVTWLSRLRNKNPSYWASALIVLLVSTFGAPYVYDLLHLAQPRARLFQYLLALDPRPLEPRFAKVVLVGDDEFWKGYPAGRRPLKRDYIASLVNKLVQAGAHVIALDFDMQLPDPEASQPSVSKDYIKETNILIRSIIAAAEQGKKIVLPRTIWLNRRGEYYLEPDIFQPYGICTNIGKDGKWENPGSREFSIDEEARRNITCGYIALPYDILMIPERLKLNNDRYIDSLALAVARAANPELMRHVSPQPVYSNDIPEDKMREFGTIISANHLLNADEGALREELGAQTVIVGGNWSIYAYDRGHSVDLHENSSWL